MLRKLASERRATAAVSENPDRNMSSRGPV
jgi:hypothetical protein